MTEHFSVSRSFPRWGTKPICSLVDFDSRAVGDGAYRRVADCLDFERALAANENVGLSPMISPPNRLAMGPDPAPITREIVIALRVV